MIATHMDQQGGKLGKLAISVVDLMGLSTEDAELFFALLKMSNSWSINLLLLENHTPHDYWTSLASISAANGHINQLILPINNFEDGELNLNALRKVWEIRGSEVALHMTLEVDELAIWTIWKQRGSGLWTSSSRQEQRRQWRCT